MDLSPAINLICKFEGCKLQAYTDFVGHLTIGWGTTHGVTPGMVITQEDADTMLFVDCSALAEKIKSIVSVEISNNALCALISFSYNLGVGSLFHSTLLTMINAGVAKEDCALEFLKWNHAGGKVVEGLTTRRQSESELFLS